MIPVFPNEFLSLPAIEHAIHQTGNIQISRKTECIVLTGPSLAILLKVAYNTREIRLRMPLDIDITISRRSNSRANLFACKWSFPSTGL
jgi:hypothetical protein